MSTLNVDALATDFLGQIWHRPGMKKDRANHLRAWREAAGLSQEELGAPHRLSKSAVSKIETGGRALTYEKRTKFAETISKALGQKITEDRLIYQPPDNETLRRLSQSQESPQHHKSKEEPVRDLLRNTVAFLVDNFGIQAVLAELGRTQPEEETRPQPRREAS